MLPVVSRRPASTLNWISRVNLFQLICFLNKLVPCNGVRVSSTVINMQEMIFPLEGSFLKHQTYSHHHGFIHAGTYKRDASLEFALAGDSLWYGQYRQSG